MGGLLKLILGGGAKAVSGAVTEVAGAFRPNAEAQAQRDIADITSARNQFAAEFGHSKTLWDSFIDGINRTPRPALAWMAILYLILSFTDPEAFAKINLGLATVPEAMWLVIGGIIGFYFCLRSGEKVHTANMQRRMVESVTNARKIREELAVPERELAVPSNPVPTGNQDARKHAHGNQGQMKYDPDDGD